LLTRISCCVGLCSIPTAATLLPLLLCLKSCLVRCRGLTLEDLKSASCGDDVQPAAVFAG
jgi:hypothetical protein